LVAKDTFHVSYGGAALNSSMAQVTFVFKEMEKFFLDAGVEVI